jgi:hypothetical protein
MASESHAPAPWWPLLSICHIFKLLIIGYRKIIAISQPLICQNKSTPWIWVLGLYKIIFLCDATHLFFNWFTFPRWSNVFKICIRASLPRLLSSKIYSRQKPFHRSQWPSKSKIVGFSLLKRIAFMISLTFLPKKKLQHQKCPSWHLLSFYKRNI